MKLEEVEDTRYVLSTLYAKSLSAPLPFQESSWNKFLAMGFPDKRFEAFQYVPWSRFHELLQKPCDLKPALMEEKFGLAFVWKDGLFSESLSDKSKLPKQVVCLSLQEAIKSSYGPFLRHRMQLLEQQEEDSLALLNSALSSDGLFLYVPPNIKIEIPLQFLSMYSEENAELYVGPKIHIFVGAGSQVEIINSLSGPSNSLYNGYIDIALEEKAFVSFVTYGEKAKDCLGFLSIRASLKKESNFHACHATLGSPLFRCDYRVSLLGEGANAKLSGLAVLAETRHSHVHVYMDHSAFGTFSQQKFKSVLFDQSRASFTGKIHVKRAAQKTESYQLTQSLLLSNQAITYAKPNLEIFADDVKASHGATVSQLDEQQMLYLQTRGICPNAASALLVQGFCQEIVEEIASPAARARVASMYQKFLSEQGSIVA
jgi:Fe-S cluster assembly protein SufD